MGPIVRDARMACGTVAAQSRLTHASAKSPSANSRIRTNTSWGSRCIRQFFLAAEGVKGERRRSRRRGAKEKLATDADARDDAAAGRAQHRI